MSDEILAERRRALEESFFRQRNLELVQRLKQEVLLEAKRSEFARASGICDPKLLDRLIHLNMDSPTVAALSLVPLIRIAWSDGKLDTREREAILSAAVESGMSPESASYHWLVSWLERPPTQELVDCWTEFVKALLPTISADDRDALRDGLIGHARKVAESAGGFLGLGNRVSDSERAVLDELRDVLNGT